jgi:hypothetical protein
MTEKTRNRGERHENSTLGVPYVGDKKIPILLILPILPQKTHSSLKDLGGYNTSGETYRARQERRIEIPPVVYLARVQQPSRVCHTRRYLNVRSVHVIIQLLEFVGAPADRDIHSCTKSPSRPQWLVTKLAHAVTYTRCVASS